MSALCAGTILLKLPGAGIRLRSDLFRRTFSYHLQIRLDVHQKGGDARMIPNS